MPLSAVPRNRPDPSTGRAPNSPRIGDSPRMNYFAHAALAVRRSPDRAFVLGAMLPDFATMIRARPPRTAHSVIEAGVRFHHSTDEAFHRCAAFLDMTRSAFDWLSARGVGRGPARAVAHVGVELLLDASLAHDERAQGAYLGALDGGGPGQLGRHLRWASGDERARFDRLRETLRLRGRVAADVVPALVAERLDRALSARPGLALDNHARRVVPDWVVEMRPLVASRAAPLVETLASLVL